MDETGGKPNPTDTAFLKFFLILLFGTLTVTRMELPLYSQGSMPWYQVSLRRDVPVCILLSLIFVLGLVKLGGAVRVRKFWIFSSVPALILWIIATGAGRAEAPLFFAVACMHWVLAYLAFLLIPPLLKPFNLLDFALDAFLGWTVAAGGIQILNMAANPGQLLEGVSGVFGGNRAHVGLYFLISLATAFYAWSERRSRLHVAAIAVSLICLLISGSRAAQMSAALFMVLVIMSFGSLKTYLWGVPTIVGFVAFIKLILADRAASTFAVTEGITIDESAGNRLIIWFKSWEIITQSSDHFLMGIGFSNFRFLYNKLVTAPFYANAAHNLYLHYWVETGVVGLALLLIICVTFVAHCWRAGARHPNLRYMAFLTLGVIFTGFTQESLLPDPSLGNVLTLYFLIMGIAIYKAASADALVEGLIRDLPSRSEKPA